MKRIAATLLLMGVCEIAMAYSLHIRKENYWEIDNPAIDKEKWLALCAEDPSMRVQNSVTGINPVTHEKIVMDTEGSCVWIDPNTLAEYVFHYSRDGITLGSDDIQILKAKEIASRLGLKVYGDEGEEY